MQPAWLLRIYFYFLNYLLYLFIDSLLLKIILYAFLLYVGGNLSTYKELCGLATDMGQPDLVYKFMHLANYNATWNSRKGAAFGFSSIAAAAGDHLEQYLPKIIPKLYRYTLWKKKE